jgi:hypothetical protein
MVPILQIMVAPVLPVGLHTALGALIQTCALSAILANLRFESI